VIAIETAAGHGEAVIVPLRDGREGRPKYTRLYRRRRRETRTNDHTSRDYGFKINDKTRPQVLSLLQRAYRERLFPWVTSDLLQESGSFVTPTSASSRAQLTAATTTACSPGRSRSSSTASSATTPAGRAARGAARPEPRQGEAPMLKKLHDAAKRVLALRDGQHSLGEEIEAYAAARATPSTAPPPSSRPHARPRSRPRRSPREEGVAHVLLPSSLAAPLPLALASPTRSAGPRRRPPPANEAKPVEILNAMLQLARSTARSSLTSRTS
jgi:hypothetical protein